MSAPSVQISSLDSGSITQYDSIILDEEDVSSIGNVSLIDHGLVDCHMHSRAHNCGNTTTEFFRLCWHPILNTVVKLSFLWSIMVCWIKRHSIYNYTCQMHSIIGRAASGQHNVMQCINQSTYCMNLYCNENYMDNIA